MLYRCHALCELLDDETKPKFQDDASLALPANVTAVAMPSVAVAARIAVSGAIRNAAVKSGNIASGSISQFQIANADVATRGSILSIRPAVTQC